MFHYYAALPAILLIATLSRCASAAHGCRARCAIIIVMAAPLSPFITMLLLLLQTLRCQLLRRHAAAYFMPHLCAAVCATMHYYSSAGSIITRRLIFHALRLHALRCAPLPSRFTMHAGWCRRLIIIDAAAAFMFWIFVITLFYQPYQLPWIPVSIISSLFFILSIDFSFSSSLLDWDYWRFSADWCHFHFSLFDAIYLII